MAMGRGSLGALIDDPGPCPVCDGWDCEHRFYGEDHYRIGDPMSKHPIVGKRHIPAPHTIFNRDTGQVIRAKGDLLSDEEAVRYGIPIPQGPAQGRKKGRRQRPSTIQGPQGPEENRAHQPDDNRTA